jgi:hypothetical protein
MTDIEADGITGLEGLREIEYKGMQQTSVSSHLLLTYSLTYSLAHTRPRPTHTLATLFSLTPSFLPIELFLEAKPIGNGAFGVVYRGFWRGAPVAVKRLRVEEVYKNDGERFLKEVG